MPTASLHDDSSPMDASPDHSQDGNGESTNTPANSTPRDAAIAGSAPGISHSASGATVIDPSVEPSSTLNPRSCVTCRRRKVRCDKRMPCSNCRKARISCIFPAPGRAPRRPRPRDPNAPPKQTSEREVELIKRLRKLEGIVEELSGQIEVEARHPSSAGESPDDTTHDVERRRQDSGVSPHYSAPAGFPPLPSAPGRLMTASNSPWGPMQSPTMGVNKDFGRLVLNDKGKTRYVSNAFWSKMNDELTQLRAETQKLTDEETLNSEDDGSSLSAAETQQELLTDHHAFVLGYRSCDVDLRKLHPLPSQIPFIWQVYVENVDPLVKILHVPSMNPIIRKIRSDMDNLSPGLEALMFSIYYAAITSLEDDEVKTNFGAEKSHLIKQFRYGTEQALAKANFLNTSDLVVIQAFAIFLVLVRRYDNTRFSWTLTGLLIRISQSVGTHREGTHFANLKPFEIEMRRRLWWAICILDLRSAEDQGTELTIAEHTFDTQFPLNINDSDISPDMKEFPKERHGATDMTFCLIRYEICSLARRLHAASNSMAPCPRDTQLTLQEREEMLLEMYTRVEDRYLKPCTDQDGDLLHWVAAAIARLIMAKMSLIIYQPILFPATGQEISQEVRDRIFMSSTEVVEYNRLLNTEPKCKQYRWLFQTYTQWHAVAYLLLEICRRPWSSSVERAWLALSDSFSSTDPHEFMKLAQHKGVWLPLKRLMLKAGKHREEEVSRLQADPQAALQLEEVSFKRTSANFHNLPSSVRETIAQDRWRKLVGLPVPERKPHDGCFNGQSVRQQAPSDTQPINRANAQVQNNLQRDLSQTDLDYISGVMTQPDFNPTDFWSVAFHDNSNDIARQAIFGNGLQTGSLPQPQAQQPSPMMPRLSSNGSPITSKGGIVFPRDTGSIPTNMTPTTQTSAMSQPAVLAQATGMLDDNPPPWLWPNAWKWNDADATANLPLNTEEVDVNMEEDFNWQDWQQSIRGFELDAGLGSGMAGGGFSGGV
ncbi:putative Zn(2)-C6 fungal-type domain-containing protein [Seiridium unicorne]|uniref:Zn(2)-C6 fungal-type domain-containing protein n=1 Tax=Seiridium unicorne TaxID=138068 RepID=A0ABR2V1K7_9PEZI